MASTGVRRAARTAGDDLAALISDSHMRDVERSRRWSRALVEFCIADSPSNKDVINGWLEAWVPLAERAVTELLVILPSADAAAANARARSFRHDLGFESGIAWVHGDLLYREGSRKSKWRRTAGDAPL